MRAAGSPGARRVRKKTIVATMNITVTIAASFLTIGNKMRNLVGQPRLTFQNAGEGIGTMPLSLAEVAAKAAKSPTLM